MNKIGQTRKYAEVVALFSVHTQFIEIKESEEWGHIHKSQTTTNISAQHPIDFPKAFVNIA